MKNRLSDVARRLRRLARPDLPRADPAAAAALQSLREAKATGMGAKAARRRGKHHVKPPR